MKLNKITRYAHLFGLISATACFQASSASEQNYAEALQKSVYFYDTQRSGPLPKTSNQFLSNALHKGFLPNRVEWRGDSYTEDGKYNQFKQAINIDLNGGWHDAGDHVKFGLPMAFSASVFGWGILEFWEAYEDAGQLEYAIDNLRWVSDYFIKAHVSENEFYAQVGNGEIDHSLWAPPEVQGPELKRTEGDDIYRPALKLDMENPGADLVGQTAAALAIAHLIFKKYSETHPEESEYAQALLEHSEQLFSFAWKTKDFDHSGADVSPGTYTKSMVDNSGHNYALSYYNATSGAKDEIPWAAAWLYLATKKADYLHKAEANYTAIAGNTGHFAWYPAWDDIRNAVYYVMAKVAKAPTYAKDTQLSAADTTDGFYDYELHSSNYLKELLNNKTYTPGGMIFLDGFASARASAMVSMVALVHKNYLEENNKDSAFQAELVDFATGQIDYILGDNPHNMSYMVGYGDNWQTAAHHRASHGSTSNDIDSPTIPRHILYGALAGGPDVSDGFSLDRAEFPMTEVATDMNAGFTGALAGLVKAHGGKPLLGFPTAEDRSLSPEAYVEAKLSFADAGKSGALINIKVNNATAYPPRELENMSFRYFFDMSDDELNSFAFSKLKMSIYYDSSAQNVPLKSGKVDGKDGVYYLEGTLGLISPVGDGKKSAQMEIYLGDYALSGWDYTNDPSFVGLTNDSFGLAEHVVLYDGDGHILWGTDPNGNGPEKKIIDSDGDGIADDIDNCPHAFNEDQTDVNNNGIGDSCEEPSLPVDTDGDDISDEIDNCPNIANQPQNDINENGVGDACDPIVDIDNDGVFDFLDNCLFVANSGQWDKDSDGLGNECDLDIDGDGCDNSNEPNSQWNRSVNGCIVDGPDADGDSIPDSTDNCVLVVNPGQWDRDNDGIGNVCDADIDGDHCANIDEPNSMWNPLVDGCKSKGNDIDGDGVIDAIDNCLNVINSGQWDKDNDGVGNACDLDIDGDGCPNIKEPDSQWNDKVNDCIVKPNDADGDGILDDADNCVDEANPGQWDKDNDGIGNECDLDLDGDGCANELEPLAMWNPHVNGCPMMGPDSDGDGVIDALDNCIDVPNLGQWDWDNDGVGNECDFDLPDEKPPIWINN